MALDHEEQEQLAALKGWWQEHGNLVVTALVAVALASAGWRGWSWYQNKQSLEASTLYQMLTRAVQAGDAKTMRDASGALAEDYPRTLYGVAGGAGLRALLLRPSQSQGCKGAAPMGARAFALRRSEGSRAAALRGGATRRESLRRSPEDARCGAWRSLCRPVRGATGRRAGRQRSVSRGRSSARLVAKRQAKEAKAAYQVALDKAGKDDNAFRESVRMRLEALGG